MNDKDRFSLPHLALIVNRALDPTADDSAFSRRIRALYRRFTSRSQGGAVNHETFLRLLTERLSTRSKREGWQDSRLPDDTVRE